MIRQVQEIECDQCGKTLQFSQEEMGNNPLRSWLHVQTESDMIGVQSMGAREAAEFDFCCKNCMIHFFDPKK